MLVKHRRADGSDAILHHEIVAIVGQCVGGGVVVKARLNLADAGALCSRLGAYLIESNFLHAYAFFCLRIFLIQFVDMKSLEVDWFSLNGGRRRSPECEWLSALDDDDDRDNRNNGDGD